MTKIKYIDFKIYVGREPYSKEEYQDWYIKTRNERQKGGK